MVLLCVTILNTNFGKKHCERKEYVTMLFSWTIQKRYNHGDKEVFIDKLKFNKIYCNFRTTKSFDMNVGVDSFVEFVKSCNRNILMKPLMGAFGQGIYKPDVSSDEKIAALYKKIKNSGEDYLAEQIFEQTGILHDVNPSAVNTVRIFHFKRRQECLSDVCRTENWKWEEYC